MPRVSDFITIISDSPRTIGVTEIDFPFHTGGRVSGEDVAANAIIMFNLRRLRTRVPVKVNNIRVGFLEPYPNTPDFQNSWFTQTINMFGSRLNNGNNVLELEAHPGDSFEVKNVYCFFHQNA